MQLLISDRLHRGVLRRLPQDFTPVGILDIGCGTGRLLRKPHNRWSAISLVGFDSFEGIVARALKLTSSATTYQASTEYIPLVAHSINLATITMSFHH